MIKEAVVKIVNKEDLTYDEAYTVMNEIMGGETTATQNAAFLAALSTKSARAETTDEIAGCAAAMRAHATKVETGMELFEIVGTGGDNAHSFNISTTSAIVAAAGGMKVAKHGNRAASSLCGTADCLEALGVNISQSPKRCVELLNEVGLPDAEKRLKNFPHQFSGGQLQRISIALSLAQGCDLLIADEPTTALDVTIQAQIVELLADLRNKRGLSIIFISHNIDLVASLCDNIIVMYGGLIMEKGTSAQIIKNPRHPYTKALLASTPKFGSHYTEQELSSIPGRVTDPASPVPGCPFAPRCGFKKDECEKENFRCYKMI